MTTLRTIPLIALWACAPGSDARLERPVFEASNGLRAAHQSGAVVPGFQIHLKSAFAPTAGFRCAKGVPHVEWLEKSGHRVERAARLRPPGVGGGHRRRCRLPGPCHGRGSAVL